MTDFPVSQLSRLFTQVPMSPDNQGCISVLQFPGKDDHPSDSKPVTLFVNWIVGIKLLHYT